MRTLNVNKIKSTVAKLSVDSNIKLRDDILNAVKKALKGEKAKIAKDMLKILLENAAIAKKEKRALCQDTGIVSVYLEIGQNVRLVGGALEDAVNKGVKEGYKRAYFRKSVVKSPLIRVNTGTNAPAMIYTRIVKGNKVKVSLMPKGFGSENKSAIKMLLPTDGEKEIISFVSEVVKKAGPDACPPYILGIGIGGTFEKASSMAKEALLWPIDKPNLKKHLKKLESKILKKVNKLGIGPMGLGGKTTCLGVKILECPTHIAGLPVAVNIGCHITRSAAGTI